MTLNQKTFGAGSLASAPPEHLCLNGMIFDNYHECSTEEMPVAWRSLFPAGRSQTWEINMENREINKELDKIKSDVASLREDMGSLLEVIKKSGLEQGRDFYDKAYERARRAGESARDRADEAYAAIGKEVGDYPFVSLLTAFATGFVVGMVLDRRR
jgi:ElaB/YqjD/DUF883 family membrane-anchored ribosome-binding protein